MEPDNGSRNSTPSAGESNNVSSTEKLLSRLSISSDSRARRHSGSPSGRSTYSEGESGLGEQDEEEPAQPFFDEQFKLALKGGVSLAGEIADTLARSELVADTSSHLHLLWKSATALRSYKSPITRVIGIVGDSGEGSSHHKFIT
jgi:hypothetical protein